MGVMLKKFKNILNKSDLILIGLILIASLVIYVLFYRGIITGSATGPRVAVVTYQNKEVMRLDMSVNRTYRLQAKMGEVVIEVSDDAVRVEKETSPYHLCSLQGWVSSSGTPIICLPNELIVEIENGTDEGPDVTVQ
jgi:hypothetical protein